MARTPFAPGTELLVRFSTRAYKVLGAPGAPYLSRQATNITVGETVEVVEDEGAGALLVRWGKYVLQVHGSDLMPKPDGRLVAFTFTNHQAMANTVETAKRELGQMFDARDELAAQVAALKAENAALRLRLTTAQVKLQALVADLDRPVVARAPNAPDSAS